MIRVGNSDVSAAQQPAAAEATSKNGRRKRPVVTGWDSSTDIVSVSGQQIAMVKNGQVVATVEPDEPEPVTQQPYRDLLNRKGYPVVLLALSAPTGQQHIYDAENIESWLRRSPTDPMTRAAVPGAEYYGAYFQQNMLYYLGNTEDVRAVTHLEVRPDGRISPRGTLVWIMKNASQGVAKMLLILAELREHGDAALGIRRDRMHARRLRQQAFTGTQNAQEREAIIHGALCESVTLELHGVVVRLLRQQDPANPEYDKRQAEYLARAVNRSHRTLIGTILNAGADPNGVFDDMTMLERAARFGYLGVVKILIKAGADPSSVILDDDLPRDIREYLVARRAGKETPRTL